MVGSDSKRAREGPRALRRSINLWPERDRMAHWHGRTRFCLISVRVLLPFPIRRHASGYGPAVALKWLPGLGGERLSWKATSHFELRSGRCPNVLVDKIGCSRQSPGSSEIIANTGAAVGIPAHESLWSLIVCWQLATAVGHNGNFPAATIAYRNQPGANGSNGERNFFCQTTCTEVARLSQPTS